MTHVINKMDGHGLSIRAGTNNKSVSLMPCLGLLCLPICISSLLCFPDVLYIVIYMLAWYPMAPIYGYNCLCSLLCLITVFYVQCLDHTTQFQLGSYIHACTNETQSLANLQDIIPTLAGIIMNSTNQPKILKIC